MSDEKKLPEIYPGDTVKVHVEVKEKDKKRIQVFTGVVISVRGSGVSKSITVRKVSMGIGVERIFPLSAPVVKKIDVESRGKGKRAKLYYLRHRIGKKALLVDQEETEIVPGEKTVEEGEELAEAKAEVEKDEVKKEAEVKKTEKKVEEKKV